MDKIKSKREVFDDMYYEDLGMCGCGMPEEVKNFIYDLLKNHIDGKEDVITYNEMVTKRKDIISKIDSNVIFEFVFHVLENVDLIAHDFSVYGSWLTGQGKTFFELLEEFKDDD